VKNSCGSVSKLLGKYFDQEVTDGEKIFVEGHLQDCPVCRDTLRSMEEVRTLIRVPVEEAVQTEDFPWVWQKIEREIRLIEKPSGWQALWSRIDLRPLFQRRVWIPVLTAIAVFLFVTTQFLIKKTPSYSDSSVVEYVESDTYNVMVYESEKPNATVIWLFEAPEQESTTS
jgi:hypothetical protein